MTAAFYNFRACDRPGKRHMLVNIGKFARQAHHLDEFVALGALTARPPGSSGSPSPG